MELPRCLSPGLDYCYVGRKTKINSLSPLCVCVVCYAVIDHCWIAGWQMLVTFLWMDIKYTLTGSAVSLCAYASWRKTKCFYSCPNSFFSSIKKLTPPSLFLFLYPCFPSPFLSFTFSLVYLLPLPLCPFFSFNPCALFCLFDVISSCLLHPPFTTYLLHVLLDLSTSYLFSLFISHVLFSPPFFSFPFSLLPFPLYLSDSTFPLWLN